jgi:hypothetical protein
MVYTPHAVVHHPYPRTMQDLRKRNVKLNIASAGYITLLFVEEPRYRRRIIRYVADRLRGISRPGRKRVVESGVAMTHRWTALLAWFCGPALYARSRLERPPLPLSRQLPEGSWSETPGAGIREAWRLTEPSSTGVSLYRE